ncbi:hypothetical protein AMECASPLE_012125 [Ameca splendens]|uniref:Uncharacterized protein n=1 Tax=Ameca splendens TaxID=208324 RepID=A0ABV0ZKQ0_9TELE
MYKTDDMRKKNRPAVCQCGAEECWCAQSKELRQAYWPNRKVMRRWRRELHAGGEEERRGEERGEPPSAALIGLMRSRVNRRANEPMALSTGNGRAVIIKKKGSFLAFIASAVVIKYVRFYSLLFFWNCWGNGTRVFSRIFCDKEPRLLMYSRLIQLTNEQMVTL